RDARYRCNQGLFEKSELAVPQEANTRKDGRKQHGHSDNTRGDELNITAVTRTLKYRSQAETEHEQIEQRLTERRYHHRSRTEIALQFSEPKYVNCVQVISST